MPDHDPIIPPPPETMRATPQAIAHELEPHIERITVAVLSTINRLFVDFSARADRDALKAESGIKELRAQLATHNHMVTSYLTTMQASIVEVATTQKKQGAMLRAHAGRIRVVEVELRRIKANLLKKRAKRRAHHTR